MQLDIRSFKNTDTRQICRVWNEHQVAVGLDYFVSPLSFELCVLSKPHFDPEFFFVAELDGKVTGFAHLGFGPEQNLMEIDPQHAILCSLCLENTESDASIAMELLARVARAAAARHSTQIRTTPTAPHCPFYIGLAPGDGLMGVIDADFRLRSWLSQAGFKPAADVIAWAVEASHFHPPIDRVQIQIRRTAHVDRRLEEPELPWWTACVLGHTDQVEFQLTLRKEKKVICEAFLWTIDHEVSPTESAIARLWITDRSISCESVEHYVFLLSEAFRQLFVDRVQAIHAFTASDDLVAANILKRVGMSTTRTGTIFTLQL